MTAEHTNISSLKRGNILSGFYLVSNVKEKLTVYGFPYVTGTLSDLSGNLRFVMWNPCTITGQVEGKIIYVGGEINEYKDKLQAELYDARVPDDGEISDADRGYIIPIAPIDIEKAYQEIGDILSCVLDSAYGQVAMWIYIDYENQIKRCPAAKSIHHAYVGGMVTHILFMLRAARHMMLVN